MTSSLEITPSNRPYDGAGQILYPYQCHGICIRKTRRDPRLFGPRPERDASGDPPNSGCLLTSDPVGLGYVESLSRPAGNLTGFMLYQVPVAGKLVELLKEIDPRLARVGLLFNPDNVSAGGYWHSIQAVPLCSYLCATQPASSRLSMVSPKA